jgi:hypothetical protein
VVKGPRNKAVDKTAIETFSHTFVVAVPRLADTRLAESELLSEEFDNANGVAVTQMALNAGLHCESVPERTEVTREGSTLRVTYSAPVHAATEGHPAEAVTPSAAIDGMGGDTSAT